MPSRSAVKTRSAVEESAVCIDFINGSTLIWFMWTWSICDKWYNYVPIKSQVPDRYPSVFMRRSNDRKYRKEFYYLSEQQCVKKVCVFFWFMASKLFFHERVPVVWSSLSPAIRRSPWKQLLYFKKCEAVHFVSGIFTFNFLLLCFLPIKKLSFYS